MNQPPDSSPKKVWKPAPEAENRGGLGPFLGRTAALLAGLLLVYFLFTFVTGYLFQPHYEVTGVIAPPPEEPVDAGAPLRLGLRVRNDRWEDGAAYVLLVIEGETEIEGPVLRVPAREEAEVTLTTSSLAPGWRTGALILYDAYRENLRAGSSHGIPIRVGKTSVRIIEIRYPASLRRGETLPIRIHASNESGVVPTRLVPIAVLLSDSEARKPKEKSGRSFMLEAGGESEGVRLDVPTDELDPGNYYLTVILSDPGTGRRIGEGVYRKPLRITQ